MARANRHYIPNCIWHITHRCHKADFLLKFLKDKKRWLYWLFEAKKRFGLRILNYSVTSNHVHLLVVDSKKETIPKSIQLIAGRTAREYNIRKKRNGAFWEDRYHATAIEDGVHLLRCLIYIDMNMVRTGVVNHPKDWDFCGYNEIFNPPERYSLIDIKGLISFCGYQDKELFRNKYKELIEEELFSDRRKRDSIWTESIAVGSKSFAENIMDKFGSVAVGRNVKAETENYSVKENQTSYNAVFTPKKGLLRPNNRYFWDVFP
jgi:putative transposase